MHKQLKRFLIQGEREIYETKEKEIKGAWTSVLYEAKWADK